MKNAYLLKVLGFVFAIILPQASHAIAITDVTLDGNAADAAALGPDNNDSASEIGVLFAPDDWLLLLKTDDGSAGSYGGIDFTVAGADPNSPGAGGDFTLSWLADPATLLPVALDLVFVTKASPAYAGYLFEDQILTDESGTGAGTGSSEGTWEITFTNSGGNIPELSHFSVYVRDGDFPVCTPGDPGCGPLNPAPAPATLFLMALGLFGLRLRRR